MWGICRSDLARTLSLSSPTENRDVIVELDNRNNTAATSEL